MENFALEINNLKINNNYVPVNEETSIVKIFGYIAKPELAKKTRGEQYLFVNKRYFKSNYSSYLCKNFLPRFFIYCIFMCLFRSCISNLA